MVQIVVEYGGAVQVYQHQGLEQTCVRPTGCLLCRAIGQMIGHGYYPRQPQDGVASWIIRIKRWLCKVCGRTVSARPSFLLRYRHYLVGVIEKVLRLRLEQKLRWEAVHAGCAPERLPAKRTAQRWCTAYTLQAGRWLAAVHQTLAQQDSLSAWLDPHGEAPQGANAGQALWTASEHLLGWAKTQWPELADYGLEKRLQFLGFWGAGQGLGRLV